MFPHSFSASPFPLQTSHPVPPCYPTSPLPPGEGVGREGTLGQLSGNNTFQTKLGLGEVGYSSKEVIHTYKVVEGTWGKKKSAAGKIKKCHTVQNFVNRPKKRAKYYKKTSVNAENYTQAGSFVKGTLCKKNVSKWEKNGSSLLFHNIASF
jgi:hypothetical protein